MSKIVKIENYKEKVLLVRTLMNKIVSFDSDAEIELEAEDLYPENIDKTIIIFEGYLHEIGYKEGQTTETKQE